jgi:hypothetical protein
MPGPGITCRRCHGDGMMSKPVIRAHAAGRSLQPSARARVGDGGLLRGSSVSRRSPRRWRIETTFQEVREHLGVETQRQWSDLAILRTTPALLGLYSLVTVWAHGLTQKSSTVVRPPGDEIWVGKDVQQERDVGAHAFEPELAQRAGRLAHRVGEARAG